MASRQQNQTSVEKTKIKPKREKGLASGSLFPIGTTLQLFTASLGPKRGIVGCSFTVTGVVVEEEDENESTTIEADEGAGSGLTKCSTTRIKKTNDSEKTTSLLVAVFEVS
jgi:hypothetical protein